MNMIGLRVYLALSGGVFAIVALLHLWRAVYGWEAIVGPYNIAVALSWIGFVVAGSLSAWAWRLFAAD